MDCTTLPLVTLAFCFIGFLATIILLLRVLDLAQLRFETCKHCSRHLQNEDAPPSEVQTEIYRNEAALSAPPSEIQGEDAIRTEIYSRDPTVGRPDPEYQSASALYSEPRRAANRVRSVTFSEFSPGRTSDPSGVPLPARVSNEATEDRQGSEEVPPSGAGERRSVYVETTLAELSGEANLGYIYENMEGSEEDATGHYDTVRLSSSVDGRGVQSSEVEEELQLDTRCYEEVDEIPARPGTSYYEEVELTIPGFQGMDEEGHYEIPDAFMFANRNPN